MYRRLPPLLALSALLVAALALAACGSSGGGSSGGAHPDYAKALRGAPAPLAALYKRGDQLLPGGTEAFEKQIAQLHGYPVVANVWASWCGPCQFEFPVLQKLSARYGKQVAFLGVNSEDSEAAAKTFLREEPVPYPSFADGERKIARSLGADVGLPDTAFFDKRGKLVYLKQGPYAHDSELEEDVRRYALEQG
ncbi:MAG TPA: TlpA disulfide reductase family protein [Solirubrobacterales bacterium]|jgi:cytochrome c biogenesis protein CcmG/thiol:disulfide interchange protein DsbE